MLRTMALTRAFDDRMYRGQRQGKTSFYMKCTGEEATSVAAALALAADDMVFPSYRQQGMPDRARLSAGRDDQPDLLEPRRQAEGPPAADHVFGRAITASSRSPATSPRSFRRRSGWAMASAIKGDSRIAAAWVGEGSTAEGDFHSALTFAAVYNAPVIFNVVNNQWAISSFSGFAGAERATFAARGDRLWHRRPAGRRQRRAGGLRRRALGRRPRARERRADADRALHLPRRGPFDLGRSQRLPLRAGSARNGRSAIRSRGSSAT